MLIDPKDLEAKVTQYSSGDDLPAHCIDCTLGIAFGASIVRWCSTIVLESGRRRVS